MTTPPPLISLLYISYFFFAGNDSAALLADRRPGLRLYLGNAGADPFFAAEVQRIVSSSFGIRERGSSLALIPGVSASR